MDWTINNYYDWYNTNASSDICLTIFIYWAWYLSFKIVNNLNSHFKVIKINVTSLNPPFTHLSIPHNQYTIFTHLNTNIYHHSKYVTEKEGETEKICTTLEAQSTFPHPPPHHTHSFSFILMFHFHPNHQKNISEEFPLCLYDVLI